MAVASLNRPTLPGILTPGRNQVPQLLEGKVAIITGAARGIARVRELFAAHGARVSSPT